MSEPKRKRIELETVASGDRLWLNETRQKRILAVAEDVRLIAKYAEDGELLKLAEGAMYQLRGLADAYGFLGEDIVPDDAEPETEDTTVTEELKEQSPGVPNDQ